MKVAFAGLSHLGVCMSIAAHTWGLDVLAFDLDQERAARIAAGEFDAAEPDAIDFLQSSPDKYRVASEALNLSDADLVLITVDTILTAENENDETEVTEFINFVAGNVDEDVPIVVASQVRPGFTRSHVPTHPEIFYLMESLIFGQGIERARFPERYVVGCADPERPLPSSLRSFLELANCPIHIMTLESAEFTKLAANYLLSASITAANSLAELAALLDADWTVVESALRDDQRIGSNAYISAGLGIGGANLIRDLHGIKVLSDQLGANSSLVSTILEHSDYMKRWVVRMLSPLRRQQNISQIAVLGLAYKPGTQSTRGSVGLEISELFSSSWEIRVHDFAVKLSPSFLQKLGIKQFDDSVDCLKSADIIILATPYPEYRMTLQRYLSSMPRSIILDPYRLVEPDLVRNTDVQLIQLGRA